MVPGMGHAHKADRVRTADQSEIKELDGFLLAEDGLENLMDFSEWLRWVWDQEQGEQPPEFKSGSRRSAF
jgi:uncharacterized protein YecA (UPF0149 family)